MSLLSDVSNRKWVKLILMVDYFHTIHKSKWMFQKFLQLNLKKGTIINSNTKSNNSIYKKIICYRDSMN